MKEFWKEATNTHGSYEVSNLGRVRSVRYLKTKNKTIRTILKPQLKNGYYVVELNCYERKKYKKKVHQLVYNTFIDVNFITYFNEMVIDHIDENKLNNRVDNLQVLTRGNNTKKSKILKNNNL